MTIRFVDAGDSENQSGRARNLHRIASCSFGGYSSAMRLRTCVSAINTWSSAILQSERASSSASDAAVKSFGLTESDLARSFSSLATALLTAF